MKKIINVSRILKWTALYFSIFLPLFEAGYWITEGYPFLSWLFPTSSLPSFSSYPLSWDSLNALQKFLGFSINMIPIAFWVAALLCLSELCRSFQRLELFSQRNVKILKKAGWALVFGQIIHPLYTVFLSLALTYRNPVGHRTIAVSIGNVQFEILAIALSILLISWVFNEAAKIKEEQEATV